MGQPVAGITPVAAITDIRDSQDTNSLTALNALFNFQPNVADGDKNEVELQYLFECSELDKTSSTSQVQGVARLQSASDTVIADSDSLQLRVKISILKLAR